MKEYSRLVLKLRNQRGIVAILVGILILILLGCVAFAVDAGYLMVTRNELQNVSDAAALAATNQLGHIYKGMSYAEQLNYVCDPATIIPIAQQVALKNQAAKVNIAVNAGDVTIGKWHPDTKILTPTLNQPDAVKVIARRDDAANGPIATVFGKVLGKDTFNVTAKGTAALTGLSKTPPGGLPLPMGISKYWFTKPEPCGTFIRFYPTFDPLACAGWHTYTEDPPNAHELRTILQGLLNGSYESPETTAFTSIFNFIGGTIASDFSDLQNLFDARKIPDATSPSGFSWTTTVVVYDWPDCSNPNKPIEIVGFATIKITEVLVTPEKQINGIVTCGQVTEGRGSGGGYGTYGSISGLVQ